MINEAFIKISDYKTLQRSSDLTRLAIDKTFLCVKIWKKKKQKFLQLNFYFMPCWLRVVWKYSFPALPATAPSTTYAREKACCRVVRRQKSIFECFVLIFVAFFTLTKAFSERWKKWIIFFTLNKINLKNAFRLHLSIARRCPLYTQCTIFFIIILITFRVSVCGDVCSTWIC